MRLVTFRDGTEERLGFLLDDHVVDPKRMPDHAGERPTAARSRSSEQGRRPCRPPGD